MVLLKDRSLGIKTQKGFTLLEVLISVAIVGILAGISIPVYRSLQTRNDLDLTVSIVVQNLRRAQVLSQAIQGGSEWGVNVSPGLVTLFRGGGFAARDPSSDELFEVSDTITPSGIGEVVFSRLIGDPSDSGDIVLTAISGDTRTITINSKGSISFDISVPPAGDWTGPIVEASVDISGDSDGWKVWSEGFFAYAVRLGGSPNFIVINIVDSLNPILMGAISLPGVPEDVFVSGNYAYVASRDNANEFQVIDVSNPATPSFTGSFNAPGGADGRGVYVRGNDAFLVRISSGNDEFVVIDVSSPSAPTFVGSVNLGSTATEVVILGDYAYISSQSNSSELQVVNISNPSSPLLAGSLDLTGGSNANTLTGFGSTVVLGRASGEVYLIDVSAPAAPVVLSSLNTGGSVNDLSLGNSNVHLFLAGNNNSADFQVLDISTISFPVVLGFLDLPANLNGVYYHGGIDRALVVGDDDGAEFAIIAPQ